MNLGRLEKVPLRQVWSSESGDFTPWLAKAENLVLLGETISLDLELEATEKFVGPFRADIVCKDTLSNSWILIENQLERTDHSHLGQLLTYAAGLDAVTIVWVAERFTDEPRAALDWLNEVTDASINFFGLEIELWRIGQSPVAPKFNIISKPNDWTKSVQATRQASEVGELSENSLRRLEFWTVFRDFMLEQNTPLKSQKPSSEYWTDFAIGRSYFHLSAVVGMRDGYLGVMLILTGPHAKTHYHLLHSQREAIEAQIGAPLEWRELPDNKRSDVSLFRRNVDPTNREHWLEYHHWLYEGLSAFYHAFVPRIRDLKV